MPVHCGRPTDVMYVYVDCCYVRAVIVSSLRPRSYKNAAASKSCHVILTPLLSSCLWRAGSDRIYLLHIRTKHSMVEKYESLNMSTWYESHRRKSCLLISLGAKINEPTPRRNNFIGSLGELNAGKMSVLNSSFPPAESTDTTDILQCWHYASCGGAPCPHQPREVRAMGVA